MQHTLRRLVAAGVLATGLVASGAPAHAAATEVVTEASVTRQAENTPPTDDWVLFTRAGTPATAATFRTGPGTPPAGAGSLELSTATASQKVFLFNYDHVGASLGGVDDIAYWTYRSAGSAQQVAALNVQADYNGAAPGGFTTLVFEPVYNTAQGPVVNGGWQDWIADGSGRWWSTAPINGQCPGATGACFRTWDQIIANNPDAVVVGGVGINQGSGNAGLITAVDAFTFDETTYDLELVQDSDGDGTADPDDNCPDVANDQTDTDGDGAGNACDEDDDDDGVADGDDAFPTDASESSDNDGDEVGDNADPDDDNDGVADGDDAFPTDASESSDNDGDEVGDNADPDDDNDGVADGGDNCRTTANADQADFDRDGTGDACDAQTGPPVSKDQCKDGGWARFDAPRFRNQGDCVSYVTSRR